jgi:hypothetical protein
MYRLIVLAIAGTFLILRVSGQILQFQDFPTDLIVTEGQPYTIYWSGGNGYVNITLAYIGTEGEGNEVRIANITSKASRVI